MTRKLSLTFLLFAILALLIAACGSNDTIPPESSLEFPPDQIFYNSASSFAETPMVRFVGTAEDNVWVNVVEISFDDGISWAEATIEGQGARVSWYYEAMSSELMTTSAIQIRAADLNGNVEMTGATQPYTMFAGPTPAVLESLIASAGTGSNNDVIYLSSGAGGAYGETGTGGLSLNNSGNITIVGNGFDDTIAVGGISSITATSKTFLATTQSAPYLIQTDGTMYLKSLRIIGGEVGAQISDAGPSWLTVDDCIFTQQENWGVFVEDTGDLVNIVKIDVLGSIIDASVARGPVDHGGVYIGRAYYDIDNTILLHQNQVIPAATSAGIFIIDSAPGTIRNSIFIENEKAIWMVNSAPVISSCIIDGDVTSSIIATTTGITISKGSAASIPQPFINYTAVVDNSDYGVFIEGGTAPIFFHTVINNNNGSGFLFSGNFTQAVWPNLGDNFNISSTGANTIIGNKRGGAPINIIFSSGSLPVTTIPQARTNFWNTILQDAIDGWIWDGDALKPFGPRVPGAPKVNATNPVGSDPNRWYTPLN